MSMGLLQGDQGTLASALVALTRSLRGFLQNPISVFDVYLADAHIFGKLSELDQYLRSILISIIEHPVPMIEAARFSITTKYVLIERIDEGCIGKAVSVTTDKFRTIDK